MHILNLNYICQICGFEHKNIDLDSEINNFNKFKCMSICEQKGHTKESFLEHLYDELIDIICFNCHRRTTVVRQCKPLIYMCQPERSKREDSQKCEMRCSEHCGNTVREAQ